MTSHQDNQIASSSGPSGAALTRRRRVVLIAGLTVVYVLGFVPLDRVLGHGVVALSAVPVAADRPR